MTRTIPNPMTIHADAFRSYLASQRMLSPATVRRYAATAEAFTKFTASRDTSLRDTSEADVLAFLSQSSAASGLPSRSAWNGQLSGLRAYFTFLHDTKVVPMNLATDIHRQRELHRERVPLSLTEMVRLVDTAATEGSKAYAARNVAILEVFFHCALRVAEVSALGVDQVDLDNYVFHRVRVKGGKQLAVCFNDVVRDALERYLAERPSMAGADGPALFLSDRGERLSVRSIQAMVKRYGELAGVSRPISPHLLRHASVTQLVELGTPLRVVQEMVGHASIQTTQRYAHVTSSERRKALAALSAAYRDRRQQAKQEELTNEEEGSTKG